MMRFSHNPDELQQNSRVTAECLQSKDKPITVPVNEEKQSVIVWFKVCALYKNLLVYQAIFNVTDIELSPICSESLRNLS